MSREEIEGLLELIPMDKLFSRKSRAVKKLGLDVDALSDAEKLDLMSQEPALLKRPIVVGGSTPVLGYDVAALESAVGGS